MLRARGEAISRIGSLAFDFLNVRDVAKAIEAIEEAVSHAPNWVWLHLIHAHVLMFRANISAALRVHREYRGRMLETGETWGTAIRNHFAALRAAGVEHQTVSI